MNKQSPRGRRGSHVAFIILAVVVVTLMIGGTLVAVLPLGDSSDSTSSADRPAVQVTPGAEIARLQTQVTEDPIDSAGVVVLAEVLANSGRLSESYVWYQKATALRPDDASLRLAFGRALLRGQQWFDAELQLTMGNDLDVSSAAIAFSLGQLADQRPGGDPATARAWYQQAIDRDPTSLFAQQARTRLAELGGSPATPSVMTGP
ncbi:MAG: hypothetical protein V9F06_06310 [Thermomicrobiales bacterium]